MIKLSIIIPMYNVESYIEQCLQSLLDQSFSNEEYEIIIMDDASTDTSCHKVEAIQKKATNIQLHKLEKSGCSISRNKGLEFAKGDYIYFMDSDDYLANYSLREAYDFTVENNLDILEFEWIRTEKRDLTKSTPLGEYDTKIKSGIEYMESHWFHDSACTSLYRKKLLVNHNIKFEEGKIMEDMWFNAQSILMAKRITYCPFDVYRYIINPNSLLTSTNEVAMRKSITDFVFMIKKFTVLIDKLEGDGRDTKILRSKKQLMLFNTFKRVLKSKLNYKEIKLITNDLKSVKSYPLNIYKGNEKYRRLLTYIFNHKRLLYVFKTGYGLFEGAINRFIIQKYKKKNS